LNDPVPNHENRVAVWVGRLFHPYLICIPTLLAVLYPLPLNEAVGWTLLVVGLLLPPLMVVVMLLKRRNQFVYQRRSRTPIYLTFWVSLWVCLGLIVWFRAPVTLVASIISLIVWLPLQLAINTWVTKVSTHAAVIGGCSMALLLLGKLNHPLVLLAAILAILGVLWARVATRNHSAGQVMLGVVAGMAPVILVFEWLVV
jgi:hypothetical protein